MKKETHGKGEPRIPKAGDKLEAREGRTWVPVTFVTMFSPLAKPTISNPNTIGVETFPLPDTAAAVVQFSDKNKIPVPSEDLRWSDTHESLG